jgi:hypothetical protein
MVWEFLKVFRLYKHHKSILVTKNPRKTPLCSICSYAVGPWHEPSKSWIAAVWWWPEMKLQNHGGYTRVELFDAVIVDLTPCIHACCLWTKKYTMQNTHIKLNPLLMSRSRISCLPFFLIVLVTDLCMIFLIYPIYNIVKRFHWSQVPTMLIHHRRIGPQIEHSYKLVWAISILPFDFVYMRWIAFAPRTFQRCYTFTWNLLRS